MIGCWCEESLVDKIDRARGARTRSQFCRDALAEKLRAMGLTVPDHEAASPDRAGKGGPKRTTYPGPSRSKLELNETAASKRSAKKK